MGSQPRERVEAAEVSLARRGLKARAGALSAVGSEAQMRMHRDSVVTTNAKVVGGWGVRAHRPIVAVRRHTFETIRNPVAHSTGLHGPSGRYLIKPTG